MKEKCDHTIGFDLDFCDLGVEAVKLSKLRHLNNFDMGFVKCNFCPDCGEKIEWEGENISGQCSDKVLKSGEI